MHIPDDELEYAPTTGIKELRQKVADYYNVLYRKGKASQYTSDNVCIVPGGRAGITRIMSIVGSTQVTRLSTQQGHVSAHAPHSFDLSILPQSAPSRLDSLIQITQHMNSSLVCLFVSLLPCFFIRMSTKP